MNVAARFRAAQSMRDTAARKRGRLAEATVLLADLLEVLPPDPTSIPLVDGRPDLHGPAALFLGPRLRRFLAYVPCSAVLLDGVRELTVSTTPHPSLLMQMHRGGRLLTLAHVDLRPFAPAAATPLPQRLEVPQAA